MPHIIKKIRWSKVSPGLSLKYQTNPMDKSVPLKVVTTDYHRIRCKNTPSKWLPQVIKENRWTKVILSPLKVDTWEYRTKIPPSKWLPQIIRENLCTKVPSLQSGYLRLSKKSSGQKYPIGYIQIIKGIRWRKVALKVETLIYSDYLSKNVCGNWKHIFYFFR